MNISYRSQLFHSGGSYRSCRSHICTDHADQVPTQAHTCGISTSSGPITAKHDVNHCQVSMFTIPADHKEILQVPTQVHTCEISTSSYRSHPVNTYRFHTSTSSSDPHLPNIPDPADNTISAGHANPPINLCRSCRSYRPRPGQDEQIIKITQIPLSQVDHADPADHTLSQIIHNPQITHRYRSQRSSYHSGTNV